MKIKFHYPNIVCIFVLYKQIEIMKTIDQDFITEQKPLIISILEDYVMRRGGDRETVNTMYNNLPKFCKMYNIDMHDMFVSGCEIGDFDALFEL